MGELKLVQIVVTCLSCHARWSTWWTTPGDQTTIPCPECVPGTQWRQPMTRL